MTRKKLEVVELNKKENKILLEKKDNVFLWLFKRRGILFYILLLLLGLLIISASIIYTVKKLSTSDNPKIKNANEMINVTFDDGAIGDITMDNITPITSDTASNSFIKNNKFVSKGEILITKKIEAENYIIYYFSDGYALKINKNGEITRISPDKNGEYGVNEKGEISLDSTTTNVTITKTSETPYGNITYYSDGSAIILDSDINMFVRYAKDIHENYISDNKVSYLKETKKVGNNIVKYFYDGTILVNINNNSYIVRNEEDINISGDNITFPNNNSATVTNIKELENNIKVTYYSDGSATISIGTNIISVKKSNSIIIEGNKLIEIVDNNNVQISNQTGNITYYTNGSATLEYNGNKVYVPDNSGIKYNDNGNVKDITTDNIKLDKQSNLDNKEVSVYGEYTIIKDSDKITIAPSDNVIYDSDGYVKEINENIIDLIDNGFTISNDTNNKITYRVVLEKSNNTTLDTKYIRYMLSYNSEYIGPNKLEDNIWENDKLYKELGVTNTNYILLDTSLEAYQLDKINLVLWTDYDTIPNSMMNKRFLGTIKVYAYIEE